MSPYEIDAKVAAEIKAFERYKATPQYLRLNNELHALIEQRKRLYNAGDAEGERRTGELVRAKVQERISRFNEDFSDSLRQEARALDDMAIHYNELFADLVAAMLAKDGRTMADTLAFRDSKPYYGPTDEAQSGPALYRTQNAHGPRPRDFTQTITFKNWQHELGRNWKVNRYTLFDPVRGAMWKMLESKYKHLDPSDVLQAFLNAASKHIEIRLARNETLEEKTDPTILNQEFMVLLVKNLRATKPSRPE